MDAIQLSGVIKDYRGLRPLRVRDLVVSEGEIVTLAGPDAPSAEILTNLVTGATLPDEGIVRVFGEDTAAITDGDAWLAELDRFGIVSDRVALLDGFTVRQNIAIPLTLDIDPLPDEAAERVEVLAAEVGLDAHALDLAVAATSPAILVRVRLARAVANSPRLLLGEHPTSSVSRDAAERVAFDFLQVLRARRMTALLVTTDPALTRTADRHLVLDPATGAVKRPGFRSWFS